MNKSDTTAILLFSRSALQEAAVKVFDPKIGKKGNGTIARRLIRHTAATVRKSRLPLIRCYSPDQSGHNFGERLANAMEAAFAAGYSRVIAIGNDCPALTAPLLRDTARQLQASDLVLGPATDGGVYLIGMARSTYDRAQFIALPWQEATLQAAWAAYAANADQSVLWLTRYADIDQAEDLRQALRSLPLGNALAQALRSILASGPAAIPTHDAALPAAYQRSTPTLRGPPA